MTGTNTKHHKSASCHQISANVPAEVAFTAAGTQGVSGCERACNEDDVRLHRRIQQPLNMTCAAHHIQTVEIYCIPFP